jgi:hypothetical protein
MDERDEELVRVLSPEHPALRHSRETHARLNAEVEELSSRPYLTTEEEIHRRELQKQKLAEKDKIMRILAEYRREHAQTSSGS